MQALRAIVGDTGEIIAFWIAANVGHPNMLAHLLEVKARLANAGKPPVEAVYADSWCCNGLEGCDCATMPVAVALGLKRVRGHVGAKLCTRLPRSVSSRVRHAAGQPRRDAL
jgi:hypothetical protein